MIWPFTKQRTRPEPKYKPPRSQLHRLEPSTAAHRRFRRVAEREGEKLYKQRGLASGSLRAAPRRLVQVFGEPDAGEGYKTAWQWFFANDAGEYVCVYDYKKTALYDDRLPEPEDLIDSPTPMELRVAATHLETLLEFGDWLKAQGVGVRIEGDEYRENPDEGCIGTVSEGTLLGEDLIPKFIDALDARLEASTFEEGADEPARVQQLDNVQTELGELERRTQEEDYYESEESDWDLEWLQERLNDYAPEGCYFGAHPGDAADFGFWPAEEG